MDGRERRRTAVRGRPRRSVDGRGIAGMRRGSLVDERTCRPRGLRAAPASTRRPRMSTTGRVFHRFAWLSTRCGSRQAGHPTGSGRAARARPSVRSPRTALPSRDVETEPALIPRDLVGPSRGDQVPDARQVLRKRSRDVDEHDRAIARDDSEQFVDRGRLLRRGEVAHDVGRDRRVDRASSSGIAARWPSRIAASGTFRLAAARMPGAGSIPTPWRRARRIDGGTRPSRTRRPRLAGPGGRRGRARSARSTNAQAAS